MIRSHELQTELCKKCGSKSRPEFHSLGWPINSKEPRGVLKAVCMRCGFEWVIKGLDEDE